MLVLGILTYDVAFDVGSSCPQDELYHVIQKRRPEVHSTRDVRYRIEWVTATKRRLYLWLKASD